jgi:hypothetical protein
MRWLRRSRTEDEPALLEDLKQVLSTPTPPIDHAPSLAALHRAVDSRQNWPTARQRSWWYIRPRLAASALASGVILGGSGVAFAVSGTPLPAPVRTVAHAVGLPVDSTAVAAARSDTAALRSALNRDDTTSVATDAERLRNRLGNLSPDDHQDLGTEPDHLLSRADDLIHSQGSDHGHTGEPSSAATPASTTTTSPRAEEEHPSEATSTTTEQRGDGGGDSTPAPSTTTTTTAHDGGGDGGDVSH